MKEGFQYRLREAWRMSDRIFDMVPRERWLHRPISLRHPILFYIGHLPAFAWNQIGLALLGLGPLHLEFDALFERGIDPVGVDRHSSAVRWPEIDQVVEYRDTVRERLLELVGEVIERQNENPLAARGRILNVVLEHEYMHQETLQYMLQRMEPEELLRDDALSPPRLGSQVANQIVEVAPGSVDLGADFQSVDFGWDNEFPTLRVEVEPFGIDRFPVQNGEWREFVEAGGYARNDLWSADDWLWRQRIELQHPASWERNGRSWRCRTVFDILDLEQVSGWPVMVSCAEARAYCRWSDTRLPTEAELHRAMYGAPGGRQRSYPWGDAEPTAGVHGNFDFCSWSPSPVDAHPAGASAWGVEDTVGNVWEWTSSPFAPFPGFDPYIGSYPGYSADFFDDRHFVMLGASWATPTPLIRRSFRNWFQDQYPFVFAGFRTVRNF
jgi:ergothioneine biosynthesis protein EgtB